MAPTSSIRRRKKGVRLRIGITLRFRLPAWYLTPRTSANAMQIVTADRPQVADTRRSHTQSPAAGARGGHLMLGYAH